MHLQAAAAQLSSKLTLLPPGTLIAVLAAFMKLGAPPDPSWVLTAATGLDGRLAILSGPELQQLLALLVSLGAVLPEGWLDRANWAAQQVTLGQGQGQLLPEAGNMRPVAQGVVQAEGTGSGVASAEQQLEACQQLIVQLRELRQQQQHGGGGDGATDRQTGMGSDTVEVEVAG